MKLWKVFFVGIVVLEMSCAPTQKLISPRTMSLQDVLQRVRERNEKIATLKGNGTITIENPEESMSGSFDVQLKKPDSLRVEFGGPFGIHIGTLAVSRDRFVFYNWRENRAVIGTSDSAALQSVLRMKLQFDEVLGAFTGEFPIEIKNDSTYQFFVEDELYVLRYRSGEDTKEYRIDGDAFVVTSYRMLDDRGGARLNAFASRIEDDDSVAMPMLLRVIFPKERRSVTIAYDDVHFNKAIACAFTLPKQAEVIQR